MKQYGLINLVRLQKNVDPSADLRDKNQ